MFFGKQRKVQKHSNFDKSSLPNNNTYRFSCNSALPAAAILASASFAVPPVTRSAVKVVAAAARRPAVADAERNPNLKNCAVFGRGKKVRLFLRLTEHPA